MISHPPVMRAPAARRWRWCWRATSPRERDASCRYRCAARRDVVMSAALRTPAEAEPRRKTLARQVAERLFERIRRGELRPGQRLPTEQELVREFGVGRSSVREALQALVVIGAVDVRPRRGAVVQSIGGTEFRLNRALGPLLDSDTLIELSEMRRIV